MGETMPGPTDWAQYYQRALSGQMVTPGHSTSAVSDATVVTTTVTSSSTAPSSIGPGHLSPSGSHLSPEGRVSKPIRRRSRASRRTPTTLLNTDTTNFRAMVQQFTGGPSAPFSSTSGGGFGFGLGPVQAHPNPTGPSFFASSGYHIQQYHQQQPPPPPHGQQLMFSLNNNAQSDVFFQRNMGNPRLEMDAPEGFVMEDIPSQMPPRSSSSNEDRVNNSTNRYLF